MRPDHLRSLSIPNISATSVVSLVRKRGSIQLVLFSSSKPLDQLCGALRANAAPHTRTESGKVDRGTLTATMSAPHLDYNSILGPFVRLSALKRLRARVVGGAS